MGYHTDGCSGTLISSDRGRHEALARLWSERHLFTDEQRVPNLRARRQRHRPHRGQSSQLGHQLGSHSCLGRERQYLQRIDFVHGDGLEAIRFIGSVRRCRYVGMRLRLDASNPDLPRWKQQALDHDQRHVGLLALALRLPHLPSRCGSGHSRNSEVAGVASGLGRWSLGEGGCPSRHGAWPLLHSIDHAMVAADA